MLPQLGSGYGTGNAELYVVGKGLYGFAVRGMEGGNGRGAKPARKEGGERAEGRRWGLRLE